MLKILCVEDNRMNSSHVKKLLSRIGIEVMFAETAWQGLQKAQTEAVDLILVSLNLPDMDGLELIRRLKADNALTDIPIIAMVNTSKTPVENPCVVANCTDILTKPIAPQDLYNIVRNYLPEALETVVWFSEN